MELLGSGKRELEIGLGGGVRALISRLIRKAIVVKIIN